MIKVTRGKVQLWTVEGSSEWQRILEEAVSLPDGTRLLLDIGNVSKLETGQLISFVSLSADAVERGGNIALANPSDEVLRVTDILKLQGVIHIFASVDLALRMSW